MRYARFLLLGLLAVLTAMLPFSDARSENVAEDWIATRAEGGMVGGATDSVGNTYVAIGTNVAKYDPAGNLLWFRTFDPCGGPCGWGTTYGIAVSPTGNYVWATGSYGPPDDDEDWYTVQYDASGTFRWMRNYGGSLHDNPSALVADGSDNLYVTGTIQSGSHRDAATLKYDVDGNLIWARTFDGGDHDDGNDIGIDSSGRVYVLAMSIRRAEDFLLLIYDSGGSEICNHRYDYGNPGPNGINDIPSAIAVSPSGGAFVTGSSVGSAGGKLTYDYATIKYNSGCGVDWIRRYDSADSDNASVAALDGAGGVYISGASGPTPWPPVPPQQGVVTLRYDSGGNLVWIDRYDGDGGQSDGARSIAADEFGVYVTGYSPGASTGGDWVTLAYTPSGSRRWTERYTSPDAGDDTPASVTLDAVGGVYVAGYQSVTGEPSVLIRYAVDTDDDTVPDYRDNCPTTVNPNQENNVHPGTPEGDHCEDPDSDGVYDIIDNCPDTANPGQENTDVMVNPPGDSMGDACDPDDDNDHIGDGIDSQPLVPSTSFSDQSLGGTTFGEIISTGGLTVSISEEPNPTGVLIAASGSGSRAHIRGCTSPVVNVKLRSGQSAILTCGSAVIEAVEGPVEVELGTIVATLQTGTEMTLSEPSPGVFDITNSGGTSSILVGGLSIWPGQTALGVTDTDGDGLVDQVDNCPGTATVWVVPVGDSDCDGWTSADEGVIGTNPTDPCANTPATNDEADDCWPADFDDNQVVNITDVFNVLPPFFGSSPTIPDTNGDTIPDWSVRRDLSPDGVINITDVFKVLPPVFGSSCTP